MPGLLESVLERYAPVRRTWEQAFQMSEEDCSQLCHWALRNGSLPKGSNGGRAYLLSARNWVTFCTEHAENKEAPFMLPDGRPNCGFFFGRDTSHQRNLKQITFWHWLAQQKERGLTAGGGVEISRTRVENCTAFLTAIGHLQFRGCEREQDSKYGVLEKHEQDQLRIAKVLINNLLGAQDERTQDPWNHTKGKDLSIEQMRAVQAVTAVSWMAAGKSRHISHFMLLGLQALALHCWTHSRRTVFSKCIRMNGLSMDTYTPESAALQDVSGSCRDEEAPLIVYRMVGSQDKGHGGDKLVCGMKSQLYKCAAASSSHVLGAGLWHRAESALLLLQVRHFYKGTRSHGVPSRRAGPLHAPEELPPPHPPRTKPHSCRVQEVGAAAAVLDADHIAGPFPDAGPLDHSFHAQRQRGQEDCEARQEPVRDRRHRQDPKFPHQEAQAGRRQRSPPARLGR